MTNLAFTQMRANCGSGLSSVSKGSRQGMMVNDFIEEHNSYLRLAPEEHAIAKLAHPNLPMKARIIFKFGALGDGYWNSDHFIAHVEDAIKIAEFKYPALHNYISIKVLAIVLITMMP